MRWNLGELQPFDLVATRDDCPTGRLIRAILGSYTNHNAPVIKHNTRGWGLGHHAPPSARFLTLAEAAPYLHAEAIRVYRIPGLTSEQRIALSCDWQLREDGAEYPLASVARLWVMRVVNSLPWHIHGQWCTRGFGEPCRRVLPPDQNPLRKPHTAPMRFKKNETPRTMENRVVAGIMLDVTDKVLKEGTR